LVYLTVNLIQYFSGATRHAGRVEDEYRAAV